MDESKVFRLCQTGLLVYESVYLAHGSQHALIISKHLYLCLCIRNQNCNKQLCESRFSVRMLLIPALILEDQSKLHPAGKEVIS